MDLCHSLEWLSGGERCLHLFHEHPNFVFASLEQRAVLRRLWAEQCRPLSVDECVNRCLTRADALACGGERIDDAEAADQDRVNVAPRRERRPPGDLGSDPVRAAPDRGRPVLMPAPKRTAKFC
jgi:hypothetical protein